MRKSVRSFPLSFCPVSYPVSGSDRTRGKTVDLLKGGPEYKVKGRRRVVGER